MVSVSTWIIFLFTTSCVSPLPMTELTTRRYNGHYKKYTMQNTLKSDTLTTQRESNTLKAITPRYHNKIYPPSKSNQKNTATKISIKKNFKNDTNLIESFVQNNLEDLRLPNKTVKIITISQKQKKTNGTKNSYDSKQSKIRNKTTPPSKKQKPTVVKVISKWSDNYLKEDWNVHNIPIPNPQPEISNYSPEYEIGSASLADSSEDLIPLDSSENVLTHSVLNGNDEAQYDDCPTVYLSNSVVGPSNKQGCSDLNIAINTYVQPNPDRLPEIASEPLNVASEPLGAASSGGPGVFIEPDSFGTAAAANPLGSSVPGNIGGGTSGGLPSLPQLPGLPRPELPDFQITLGILQILGQVFGYLRGVLSTLSPLLFIIPALSFGLGFLAVLPFYPWWLPFVLFFFGKSKKGPSPPDIVFHKHVHKPIHHHDGWFWNPHTKTWNNVGHHREHAEDDVHFHLSPFGGKKQRGKPHGKRVQSWKHRKK